MDPRELGKLGEDLAQRYLSVRGWRILGRNVRVGRRELDLIVQKGRLLVFVEVKTRGGLGFGDPLEAITRKKKEEVFRAAAGWLEGRDLPRGTTIRFDALGIVRSGNGAIRITHVADAWRMG